MRPLVQTQYHSSLGRLDFTVLRVIGLEPFSKVDALVAGCYTYIVSSTDVLKILYTVIVFLQSFDVVAYVVYSLTKCSPSVTHTYVRFISGAEPKTEHDKGLRHTHTLTSRHKQ